RLAEAGQFGALVAGLPQTQSVVAWRLLVAHLLGAHRLEPLGSTPAVVGEAELEQPERGRLVQRQPLRLAIRRVWPALVGSLVPIEPEPVQRVGDLAFAAGD